MRLNRIPLALPIFAFVTMFALTAHSDRLEYLFMDRVALSQKLKAKVGSKVTTTDRLVMVYSKERDGYIFFDTHYFRCAVKSNAPGVDYLKKTFDLARTNYKDLIKELEDINKKLKNASGAGADSLESQRREVAKRIYKRWKKKALVTLFGRIERPEIWGEVNSDAKGAGVNSERVIFVVEKIETPRKRWFKEIH